MPFTRKTTSGPSGRGRCVNIPLTMAKDPVTIFTISQFFMSDPGSVQKGLKSYDAGRVIHASIDETGVITGKVKASFKKDRTYQLTICTRESLFYVG